MKFSIFDDFNKIPQAPPAYQQILIHFNIDIVNPDNHMKILPHRLPNGFTFSLSFHIHSHKGKLNECQEEIELEFENPLSLFTHTCQLLLLLLMLLQHKREMLSFY